MYEAINNSNEFSYSVASASWWFLHAGGMSINTAVCLSVCLFVCLSVCPPPLLEELKAPTESKIMLDEGQQ